MKTFSYKNWNWQNDKNAQPWSLPVCLDDHHVTYVLNLGIRLPFCVGLCRVEPIFFSDRYVCISFYSPRFWQSLLIPHLSVLLLFLYYHLKITWTSLSLSSYCSCTFLLSLLSASLNIFPWQCISLVFSLFWFLSVIVQVTAN